MNEKKLIMLGRVLGTWGLEGGTFLKFCNTDYAKGNLEPLSYYKNFYLKLQNSSPFANLELNSKLMKIGGEVEMPISKKKSAKLKERVQGHEDDLAIPVKTNQQVKTQRYLENMEISWVKVISKKVVVKFHGVENFDDAKLLHNSIVLVPREKAMQMQLQLSQIRSSDGESAEENLDSSETVIRSLPQKREHVQKNIYLISDFIGMTVCLQNETSKVKLGVITCYYAAGSDGIFELDYAKRILAILKGKKGYGETVLIPATLAYFSDINLSEKTVVLQNYTELLVPYTDLGF